MILTVIKELALGVLVLFTALAFAEDFVEHTTFKLLREPAVEGGAGIQVASFAYHQEKIPTDAAVEYNFSNCKTVSEYLTELTGERHWCEQARLLEYLD